MPGNSRWIEFFENDNGALSMNRLIILGAFIVSSYIVVLLTVSDKMTEGYFGIFLTMFVANLVFGKMVDNRTFGNKDTASVVVSNADTVNATTEKGNINVPS